MSVVSIGNKMYPFDKLPQHAQNLVKVYQGWEEELIKAQIECLKLEAAMRAVSREVEEIITGLPPIQAVPDEPKTE